MLVVLEGKHLKPTVIILIHGIRTHAEWQESILTWMDLGETVIAKPLRYGRFDLFSFLSPLWTRNRPIQKITAEIDYLLAEYPESSWRRVIVAHSFGTYAITKILEDKPAMYIDDLLLCGSIVSDKYDWIRIGKQIRGSILNDCSRKDIWPVFAKSVTWGYGATGTYGFGTGAVTNRFHDIGHSDYFLEEFVKKFWKPFIEQSEVVPASPTVGSISSPWFFQFFEFPFRWAIAALFCL